MKFLASISLVILFYFAALVQAQAYQIPQFTSCVNPQGQVKVNYDNGTHGIVGNTSSFQGKDTVYTLSGDALTQCFCSSDGKGIQTNWWKASSLTEQEIESLKSQGWKYVPNGALWGLDEAAYLAFNSEYICRSTSGGGGGALGASIGSVLGLASTGNTKFLLSIILTSVISLLVGLNLKKRTRNLSK
jgi:hypothetical protein